MPKGADTGSTAPPSARTRAAVVALALALAGGAFAWFCGTAGASLLDFPLDDAWIHQVYARGLATDGLPTYNPGEPEAGFTSALWLFALLPTQWLVAAGGWWPVVPAKLVSLGFAVLAALELGRLARSLGGGAAATRLAPVLALTSPALVYASLSGMEVTLAAYTLTAALVAHLGGRYGRAGLFLALAGLTRPELGLATVVLGAHALATAPRGAKAPALLRLLGPPALGAAAWMAYCLAVTGAPLPNTFYVKAAHGALGTAADYYARRVLLGQGLALALLTATGVALALRAAVARPALRGPLGLVVGLQAACVLALVALYPLETDTGFYLQRYFYPVTALDGAVVAVGLGSLLERPRPRPRPPALLALALVAVGALAAPGLVAARAEYRASCADIEALHTAPAREAATYAPEEVVIAAEGAGAARYHSGRYVLDLFGLNNHLLAHARDNAERTCVIVGHRPELFLVPDFWLPQLAPAFDLRVLRDYPGRDWTVVAARGRVQPPRYESCRERFGSRRLEPQQ
jgi:hypothetical protein